MVCAYVRANTTGGGASRRKQCKSMMKIEVTQTHILSGERSNPKCCAVAIACKDAGLDVTIDYIIRNGKEIIVASPIGSECIKLPKIVHDFVERFDEGKHVEPFTFELEESPT
jgi:hypothetical protein